MATTRKKRRSTTSGSALDDILGGITGTTTRRRSRRPTIGSITGGKAAAGSLLLTLAAICFAVGYYVPEFGWLIYVGLALGVIYLIVAYFKNRKKSKAESASPSSQSSPSSPSSPSSQSSPSSPSSASSHLSESQRAQILDRLKTHPVLQQLHPRLSDAAKLAVHQHTASAAALTSMLKLNEADAATVLHQLELIGLIGPAQADGTHSVYATGDAELSEWLQLMF